MGDPPPGRGDSPARGSGKNAVGAHPRDFEAAYQHATTITRPGELADHVPHALWLTLDLTEAAVRTGRHAEAAAHVAAVRQAGVAAISPRQALIIEGAAAIAAPDHEAAALFERALTVPGTDRWPFDRARIQLTFGERLRRMKATIDARAHLAAALDTFRRLAPYRRHPPAPAVLQARCYHPGRTARRARRPSVRAPVAHKHRLPTAGLRARPSPQKAGRHDDEHISRLAGS